MALEWWPSFSGSVLGKSTPKHRWMAACGVGLLLILTGCIAICTFRLGMNSKIDANRIVSPWDTSAAPPPFVAPNMIKVEDSPRAIVTPEAKQGNRRRREQRKQRQQYSLLRPHTAIRKKTEGPERVDASFVPVEPAEDAESEN